MPVETGWSTTTLWSFAMTLARVGGMAALVPIPGWKAGLEGTRVVLALALTMALFPLWPANPFQPAHPVQLAGGLMAEITFGAAISLALALLLEGFLMAAQVLGLQAGFSYASTVDPASQADSTVVQILAQLTASLLFFAFELDLRVVQAMGLSLEKHPPGAWFGGWGHWEALLSLGSGAWVTALRLSLPVVALLLLIDLTLAVASRVNAQLQLLSLAFPAKMLAAMAMLALSARLLPALFLEQAERFAEVLAR